MFARLSYDVTWRLFMYCLLRFLCLLIILSMTADRLPVKDQPRIDLCCFKTSYWTLNCTEFFVDGRLWFKLYCQLWMPLDYFSGHAHCTAVKQFICGFGTDVISSGSTSCTLKKTRTLAVLKEANTLVLVVCFNVCVCLCIFHVGDL